MAEQHVSPGAREQPRGAHAAEPHPDDAAEPHESHGHSVAAWTGVGTMLFGSAVIALGLILWWIPLAIAGAVLVVLGVVAGKVLSVTGYGQKKVADHRDGVG